MPVGDYAVDIKPPSVATTDVLKNLKKVQQIVFIRQTCVQALFKILYILSYTILINM